jgi:Cd2+/Zn2+-exporting ATPase
MRVTSYTDLLPEPTRDNISAGGEHHSHARIQLTQTAIGLSFVLNSFLYAWLFERDSPVAAFSAAIGALILGFPIVWVALKDLRRGSLNTNVLVALAVLVLFASGHYPEAGIVSFFMLIGQIIESRTAAGALASLHSLIKLTPAKARLLAGSEEREVAVHELAVGDLIRVRPGDNVAADGVIVSGQGSFNQTSITGESLPVDKQPGDEVLPAPSTSPACSTSASHALGQTPRWAVCAT